MFIVSASENIDYNPSIIILYDVNKQITQHNFAYKLLLLVFLKVESRKTFNTVHIEDHENVRGLRVCGNYLIVITTDSIILERIQVSRDRDGALTSADLKFITKEVISSDFIYDTVVSGDVAYTVFLQSIDKSQDPPPPTQGNQGTIGSMTNWFGNSYSPNVANTCSSDQKVILIQKLYLKHNACMKLDGPFVVDKDTDSICISCDGKYVAFSYFVAFGYLGAFSYLDGAYIGLYDVDCGSVRVFYRGRNKAKITSLCLSSDDKFLVCNSDRGTVHLFNVFDNDNLVDTSNSWSISNMRKKMGSYPGSFVQVKEKAGWVPFIKGTFDDRNLKLVLVSPNDHSESPFNKQGFIKA